MRITKTELDSLINCNDIIIVGPDFTDKNKLRVYANGGIIGKIYIGSRPDGEHTLITPNYYNYNSELEAIIIRLLNEGNNIFAILSNEEYILQAKEAINKRFGDKKNSDSDKKERHVETIIAKHFLFSDKDWAVIDMEVQIPRSWFKDNDFSEGTTDQPRFDIVVINDAGIGILELKVNNDNAGNLNSHYEHMDFLIKNKKTEFLKEMHRRLTLLEKVGLISEYAKKHYKDYVKSEKIWCGFLFVGGGKKGSIDLVKTLEGKKNINDFKFIYYEDTEDTSKLDINNAQSYSEFIKLDKEL